MTVKDASKYGDILNELDGLKIELEQLNSQKDFASRILDDFPKSDKVSTKTLHSIEKLETLREKICFKIEELLVEYDSLDRKIELIEDPIDRQIIRLRHINRLNFEQIGDTLFYNGGTIKNRYYRIFKNDCKSIWFLLNNMLLYVLILGLGLALFVNNV